MLDDLRQRTARDGSINRAGLEQADFDYLAINPAPEDGPLRIAYAGTIVVEREFELLVKALSQVRKQLPRPLSLDFFGDHSYRSRSWFDPAWMNEHGSMPAAQLLGALKECSWGFSPMALADDNPRYNRFSLPTKFVSYLSAGLPIITLGHPESTVVKMTSQYQVGLCFQGNDPENLRSRLLAGLSEPNPKIKYRAGIQRCAVAEFDARQMRAVLYENFRKCASITRSQKAAVFS
jgi:glycosyltransferase involved in cell wall biosynthesis